MRSEVKWTGEEAKNKERRTENTEGRVKHEELNAPSVFEISGFLDLPAHSRNQDRRSQQQLGRSIDQ